MDILAMENAIYFILKSPSRDLYILSIEVTQKP